MSSNSTNTYSETTSEGPLIQKLASPGPVMLNTQTSNDNDLVLETNQENTDPNQISPEFGLEVHSEDSSLTNQCPAPSNRASSASVQIDWIVDGSNFLSHSNSIQRKKMHRSYTRFTKYVGVQLKMLKPSKARIAMLKINKILNHFVTLQLNEATA